MPAEAPLEDLTRVQQELGDLQAQAPEIYGQFVEFFRRNRRIGYKNICKLLLGEATPQELKGIK